MPRRYVVGNSGNGDAGWFAIRGRRSTQTPTATSRGAGSCENPPQTVDASDEDPPGDAPDLTEGFDPIATNGTQTYTIIVDNIGPQDVTGIKVRDVLPAGTKFLSFSATQGFTCTHDGSTYGGNVTCIGGSLPGTAREFYDQAGTNPSGVPTGNKWARITIKVFATQFVQPILHNEVRVDPDDEIDEIDEANNFAFQDTFVTVGNSDAGAFNQLTVEKLQNSPASAVATNGILIYDLKVSNLGTDPVSAIVAKDTLPSGTRFISARDTDVGTSLSDAFFCSHDGSATGGVITCVGGDLSGSVNKIPDGVGVVPTVRTIRVKVYAPNTPATIVNIVGVDPDNQVVEGNEFDNDAALETVVRPCTNLADCGATNAFHELKLTKTQTNPAANPVARNGIVSYELKVENWGTDAVSGVVVTDRLPAGFRFINATDSGGLSDPDAFTCSGPDASGVVTCSGGALDGVVLGVADSRTIRINVFAPDEPGSYTNNSFVDPGNTVPEGNEFNNQSSVQTVVANGGNRPYVDLTIDKTQPAVQDQDTVDGRVRVVPGGLIQYALKVTNIGVDGDAFNVRVRDFLPANATFFKAEDTSPGAGAFTCGQVPGQPNTIDCIGGTIPQDGGFRTINVFVVAPTGLDQIASNQGDIKQILTNTAIVDPLNEAPEGDETNNTDAVQTLVQSQINLTVVSKEGPSQANQNQEADYVITVKNKKEWGAGRIAVDAVVVDYLPVGLIPLSVSTNVSNMACETEENPVNLVTCVGDIESEQVVEITVHVFITAEDGPLDNEACIDPGHEIDETSELDNCKTKTTVVAPPPAPNLNINKNASTGTVTPGETFTYTVTVSNVGGAAAPTGITITDDLPTQVTFVSANATNGFTCAEASGTVTCSDPGTGLAAGASTVVTIEVTVNAGVTGGFTNKASVNDTGGHRVRVGDHQRRRHRRGPDPQRHHRFAGSGEHRPERDLHVQRHERRDERQRRVRHHGGDGQHVRPDVRRGERVAGIHLRRHRRGHRDLLGCGSPGRPVNRGQGHVPGLGRHAQHPRADRQGRLGWCHHRGQRGQQRGHRAHVDQRGAVHLVHRPRHRRDPRHARPRHRERTGAQVHHHREQRRRHPVDRLRAGRRQVLPASRHGLRVGIGQRRLRVRARKHPDAGRFHVCRLQRRPPRRPGRRRHRQHEGGHLRDWLGAAGAGQPGLRR